MRHNLPDVKTPFDEEPGAGVLPALIGLILIPIFVILLWLFIAFNNRYRSCVHLENGLTLGYEAVFDLGRPLLKPITVPRYQSGRPVVRHDTWPLYISDTTVHGVTFDETLSTGYSFVWRADTGLVRRDRDPETYQKLVDEAGPTNWDYGSGGYGAGVLLKWLSDDPDFPVERCPTALFTW